MPHYEQYTPVKALQLVEKNKHQLLPFLRENGADMCVECGMSCVIDKNKNRLPLSETDYIVLVGGVFSICTKEIFESIFLEVTGGTQ